MHFFETHISVLQLKYFVIGRSKEGHPLHPTLFLIYFPSNFDPLMGWILCGELCAQAWGESRQTEVINLYHHVTCRDILNQLD
jgi:hypothetical protein